MPLYVTEYSRMGESSGGLAQVPEEPPVAEQVVAVGGGSVQSAAFNPKTRIIRVTSDANCSILIGVNPTATTNSQRLVAGTVEYKALPAGGYNATPCKIAVIANT